MIFGGIGWWSVCVFRYEFFPESGTFSTFCWMAGEVKRWADSGADTMPRVIWVQDGGGGGAFEASERSTWVRF